MDGASKDAGRRIEALGRELEGAQKSANSRYFKQTARAIEDLKDGAVSVADAFGEYNDEADAAIRANEQYQKVSQKMANGTQAAADEIDVLAEYLGNIDPNVLLQNWDMVGPMISAALAEGEAAFHRSTRPPSSPSPGHIRSRFLGADQRADQRAEPGGRTWCRP